MGLDIYKYKALPKDSEDSTDFFEITEDELK